DLLTDPSDGIFEHRTATEMIGSKDADDDIPGGTLEHPNVVADVGEEVTRFVRDVEVAYVLGQSRPINLAAHDLQHLVTCGPTDSLAGLDSLQQHPHVAR